MTTTETTTETQTIPLSPGRWTLDPAHFHVTFWARHLGVSRTHGRFEHADATLEVGASLAESRLEATVDMASINTDMPMRDEHLRSADYLDVERRPEMRFVSSSISGDGSAWQVHGDATIGTVTRPVTLEVTFGGQEEFHGDIHAGFSASGELRRDEFGLKFAPFGEQAVGNVIHFALDLELLQPA